MRAAKIEQLLRERLTIKNLVIEDQSHLHEGHAGAKEGKSHFHLSISAEEFLGMPIIQKHKFVYEALGNMMETDIHALSIDAKDE
ncbi:MAG: BolA family protein [Pseudomonadota bacterium]|nr:BolA family protein [Pseudomonadota bacterium]